MTIASKVKTIAKKLYKRLFKEKYVKDLLEKALNETEKLGFKMPSVDEFSIEFDKKVQDAGNFDVVNGRPVIRINKSVDPNEWPEILFHEVGEAVLYYHWVGKKSIWKLLNF